MPRENSSMRWCRPLLVVKTRSSSGHVCGARRGGAEGPLAAPRPPRSPPSEASPQPFPPHPAPAPGDARRQPRHLLPVDRLLRLLLDLLLRDARLHRHLPPAAAAPGCPAARLRPRESRAGRGERRRRARRARRMRAGRAAEVRPGRCGRGGPGPGPRPRPHGAPPAQRPQGRGVACPLPHGRGLPLCARPGPEGRVVGGARGRPSASLPRQGRWVPGSRRLGPAACPRRRHRATTCESSAARCGSCAGRAGRGCPRRRWAWQPAAPGRREEQELPGRALRDSPEVP